MANTFTTNYSFTKSEIGGDNQTWGNNLHTTLNDVDEALGKLLEDQLVTGITSSAIDLTASGDNGIISTSANLKYFQSVVVGDKIRVSGSSEAVNGTAANPVIHTVLSKASADSITTNVNITTDTNDTITVAKVFEPVYINSGPIVCAPLTSLSAATRTAGGVGQQGADTTDALNAVGDVTLGSDVDTDTITIGAKIINHVLPNVDDTYTLGNSTYQWKDLFIDGTANIDTLVTDVSYTLSGTGTIADCTSLTITANKIVMNHSDFGSTTAEKIIGTNGQGNKTGTTGAPSGGENGDIHYEFA